MRPKLISRPFVLYVAKPDRPAFLQHMERCRSGLAGVISELTLQPRGAGRRPLPVQLSSTPIRRAGSLAVRFRTIVSDLSERRRAEDQLTAYQERLRAMSAELSITEERERRRIALALHDNLGQVLALARIKLGTLRKELPESEKLLELQQLLGEAIQQTRQLTLELSPPTLYTLGLPAAVEWLGELFRKHGLEVQVVSDLSVPPTDDIKSLLFQAVRELLTNVVKHARAKRATVTLGTKGDCVEVIVDDDGVGYPRTNGAKRREAASDGAGSASNGDGSGFGLFNLRTRIEYLGGKFLLESHPGGGRGPVDRALQLPAPGSRLPAAGCQPLGRLPAPGDARSRTE